MKMAESCPNELKTLWEKEKLLVTSNFSFSHGVFKRLVSQGRQKVSLCGNGLRNKPQAKKERRSTFEGSKLVRESKKMNFV